MKDVINRALGIGALLFIFGAILSFISSPNEASPLLVKTGLALICFSGVAFIFAIVVESEELITYLDKVIPYFVRGISLVGLLSILIYFAFFLDKSAFSSGTVTSALTEEAKLAVLERKRDRLSNILETRKSWETVENGRTKDEPILNFVCEA